jgi:DNA-binding winged helix-turn-helix (wHTH) protein
VTVRFGDYAFDFDRRELLHLGAPVHLTPKAFELLRLLIERRPAALSKTELHDRLWPNTFVSDVNLATLVFEIREAVGDDSRTQRYIRTVRGFGYAFCGLAAATAALDDPGARPASARLIWGDREFALRDGETLVGRSPEVALWVDHPSVSRRHARIVVNDRQACLEDLVSRHGTFVDDHRIDAVTPLRDGVRLRFGSVAMQFRAYEAAETASQDD